jgi:hypothetical protein
MRRLVRALRARHYCWKTGGHVDRFVRNIYGDEINARNGMRSEWKCNCCGRWKLRPELNRYAPEFRSTNSFIEPPAAFAGDEQHAPDAPANAAPQPPNP